MVIIKNIGSFLKECYFVFCSFIVLIILVELTLQIFYSSRDDSYDAIDRRSAADTYGGAVWTEDYFRELEESRRNVKWDSYVYWRRDAYEGEHVNVTPNGLRVTPNPEATSAENAPASSIFLFGGSTMWGTGARDSFAIPAVLSREFEKRDIDVEVRNFGETGYVSAQELTALMSQLRSGEIPDIVIFYDGVNDTFSAYQQGIAGLPQNEFRRAREFNLTRPERQPDLLREGLESSSTMRFTRAIQRALGNDGQSDEKGSDQSKSDNGQRDLAQDVVASYVNNVRMIEALAASYGFDPLFYWQPTIFGKARLTEYEKGELERIESDQRIFFETTYDVMSNEGKALLANSSFQNLSEIFLDTYEPIYIDWVHLGEHGNLTVAQRIAEDAIRLFETRLRTGEDQTANTELTLAR